MSQLAQGWSKVEQATQASQEARDRAALSRLPQIFTSAVKLSKGGGPIIVRFLEQGPEVNSYGRHEYQVPDGKGGFYRRQFTCLRELPWNQPECPGCKAGMKLKTRGVYNVIFRNRPVYRQDADGKPIKHNGEYITDGHRDTVCIWDVPSTTAEVLRGKDADYHGLMGLDMRISESASSFQPYTIEPADIVNALTPMSENDLALRAQRYNLDDFMKPPTLQEALQIVSQYGANSGAQQGYGGQPQATPQGTAGQAGAANGFLAGAQVPAGMTAGSAFGAAQQLPPTPPPVGQPVPAAAPVPAPVPQAAPTPQPGVPQPMPVPTPQQ